MVTAYNDLLATPVGITVSGTSLGGGQILTPNIYTLGGALNISGDLILDGQGDPNALFIFKINGALTTLTLSKIKLAGGTNIYNVYWQVMGAVALSGDEFVGSLVFTDRFDLFAGSLMGRALSIAGAIALHGNVVTSKCAQILAVADDTRPTFDLPPTPLVECVENLNTAIYNPLTFDINPRPDYYTLLPGNPALDLTNLADESCALATLTIKWRINFKDGTTLDGVGQPSTSTIIFPGDGVTFNNLDHKITYWVVNCSGALSLPQSQTITIKPRPKIS